MLDIKNVPLQLDCPKCMHKNPFTFYIFKIYSYFRIKTFLLNTQSHGIFFFSTFHTGF